MIAFDISALRARAAPLRSGAQALRAELARRSLLASRPQPPGVARPRLRHFVAELGSGYESWRAWRAVPGAAIATPAARPVPVILLPGFATHPVRMWRLNRGLSAAGHAVEDWGLGWNMGGSADRLDQLTERVASAAERHGGPVALVGWSLGGLYAREVAKRIPDAVRLVVTMGTPFSGDLHANRAWRAYHWITGQDVAERPIDSDYGEKPPVPTYALWSARDGIIAPRSARGRPGERDEAIALRCTHLGFAGHPTVLTTILDLLDRSDAARAKKEGPQSAHAG